MRGIQILLARRRPAKRVIPPASRRQRARRAHHIYNYMQLKGNYVNSIKSEARITANRINDCTLIFIYLFIHNALFWSACQHACNIQLTLNVSLSISLAGNKITPAPLTSCCNINLKWLILLAAYYYCSPWFINILNHTSSEDIFLVESDRNWFFSEKPKPKFRSWPRFYNKVK